MRRLVVWMFMALASVSAQAQENGKAVLVQHVSQEMGITLNFPKAWGIEKLGEDGLLLSPGMHEWGETALPPAPYPWLILITPEEGVCELDTQRPFPISFERGYGEVMICKSGLFAVLGYRDKDPKREEHVRELFEILDTIKKTRVR